LTVKAAASEVPPDVVTVTSRPPAVAAAEIVNEAMTMCCSLPALANSDPSSGNGDGSTLREVTALYDNVDYLSWFPLGGLIESKLGATNIGDAG
jgi:hypothetical protein